MYLQWSDDGLDQKVHINDTVALFELTYRDISTDVKSLQGKGFVKCHMSYVYFQIQLISIFNSYNIRKCE